MFPKKSTERTRRFIINQLLENPNIDKVAPVGSRVTGGFTEESDWDYLVLVKKRRFMRSDSVERWLNHKFGFRNDGSNSYNIEDFESFRLGDINVIVTHKHKFYNRFINATELATDIGVLNKNLRIRLFKTIIYPD